MNYKKHKKAFTLIELIVVIGISSALILSLGAGLLGLQNTIKLDNAVRDLKTDLQSAQNNARNSFLIYDQSSGSTSSTDIFSQGFVSLGWLVTLENSSSSTVKITRRAVYFSPTTGYDFSRLRDEIINFRSIINRQYIACNSSGDFYATKGGTSLIKMENSYASVTGSNFTVKCTTKSLLSGNEFFENEYNGVQLSQNFGTNALPSCWDVSTSPSRQNIFFTSGYGEPVIPYYSSLGDINCQIQIQNTTTIGSEVRAIEVSYQSGQVYVCGAYCVSTK